MSTAKQLNELHILVVEDNDDTREVIQMILQAFGARVTVASGALQALALLERQPADCIVSDIAMPERDGLWLIQQIRARDGDRPVPAIAVTARVGPEHRRVILGAGFQVHLPKPVDPDHLVDAIRHAVARSRERPSR